MRPSKLLKNFSALVGANFLVQGLRFITIALLARRLGSHLFGAYNYVLLLTSYGTILVEFGLRNYAIREFSQGRGGRDLVANIFKLRLMLAVLATVVVMGLTTNAFREPHLILPSLVLCLTMFTQAILFDYIVVAREKLITQAVANVSQALFLLGIVLAVVRSGDNFMILSIAYFLSYLILASVILAVAKPHHVATETPTSGLTNTLTGGLPFLVANLISTVAFSMDLLLLGQFHYSSWLGSYSAALKVLGLTLGIINAFLAAVQPRFAREGRSVESPSLQNLIVATTRIITLLVVPTIIACWILGDHIVVWFFGLKYLDAGPLLKPLSFAMAFYCLSLSPMHALFVGHDTRALLRIVVMGCLMSFVAISYFLWKGQPQMVPWAMVFVNFVYMCLSWQPFRKLSLGNFDDQSALVIPSAIMIGCLVITPVPAAVRLIIAAIGYLCGLVLIRIWSRPWFTLVLKSDE